VITPAALLKHIFGGAPLPIRPDNNVLSYWVTRNEAVKSKEQFKKKLKRKKNAESKHYN
jgi:hypothetical protein